MRLSKLFFFIFFFISTTCWSQIPAFPGAEGFGAHTAGGRGGKVIKVTNLNDSGPGSLRAALYEEGPRIIIFTVGGIINLETKLRVHNPYITIAGQTAPGDGICIRGEGIRFYTHDVIVRYLRVRPGDIDYGSPNSWGGLDAITIANEPGSDNIPYNIVIDHCSLSWAVDEVIDMWHDTHDVTIQNCIISEGLHESKHPAGPHSKGMLIGAKATNISVHHNLFSSNHRRNPLINGESLVDFRNNLIYNPGRMATHIYRGDYTKLIRLNYVNNFIKKGKNTINEYGIVVNEYAKNHVKMYVSGNKSPFIDTPNTDNWRMVIIENDDGDRIPISISHRTNQEFDHPQVVTLSAEDAYDFVLEDAGATLPSRDPVDRKVIKDVKEGKGSIINTKDDDYEWPSYASGNPFRDSDDDGMSDYWEDKFGLNPNNAFDQNLDYDGDGYTNIEEYINQTSPTDRSTKVFGVSEFTPLSNEVPKLTLKLDQNYPNPFASSTTLKFVIDESSPIVLQLLNREGREVNRLMDDFLYEGEYEVEVDTSTLELGLYYVVLRVHGKIKSIKALKE